MHPLAIAFFVLGVILLIAEVFMPGFGLFAVFGTISLAIGIFLVEDSLYMALLEIAIVLVAVIVVMPLMVRSLTGRKEFRKFSLLTSLRTEDGFVSRSQELDGYVGRECKALTDLRPSGMAILTDGTRLDVMTQGDFIENGTILDIIDVQGTWLIVRRSREGGY